ncbi:MAG TPA: AtpZ/AtpI family protein [Vicinamibacterales bacterium]|nr:AtpZ/AtpI family protein [Vicinamibacterales bacterium]
MGGAALRRAGRGAGKRFVAYGAMGKKQSSFSFKRSAESLQDNVQRAGPAAGASYTLIGAIILLGGLGYAVDQWRGTAPWGLFVGLVLGLTVGFYELAKVVWHR